MKRLPIVVAAALLLAGVSACGGGSNASTAGGGGGVVPQISVVVQGSAVSAQAGATAHFFATVLNDPASEGVAWTVSCSALPCGTVSPVTTLSGVSTTYTAFSIPPASDQAVTVTATSLASASARDAAVITVPAVSVAVTLNVTTVQLGGNAPVSATVTNDNVSDPGVVWVVTCNESSPCGTISPMSTASGVTATYTAPSVQPAGDLSVTLTATSVANSAVASTAGLTVPGLSVSVSQDIFATLAGGTSHFTATVTNDAQNKGVTWSVSCDTAPCGTISPATTPSGSATTYTAPATPPASDLNVTVTATSVTNTASSSAATVTVSGLVLSIAPASVLVPENIALTFTPTLDNDPTNMGVTWAVSQNGTACSPGCGTVAPAATQSGSPTTYTAPAGVPANPAVALTVTSAVNTSKSTAATITVSNGTVQLVPNSLAFGSMVVGKTSDPITFVLTNTGNSSLTINNMVASLVDYQQTNDCGASVAAGQSCTISVTFTPGAKGLRDASLSIADSSADTPQQVALSGSGVTQFEDMHSSSVRSALVQNKAARAPMPQGPEKVGTTVVDMIDSSRPDPYLATGAKRELLVRLWYPASLNQACKPAEYTSPKVWSYFSGLVGVPLPQVATNSCWNAPIADGAHAVVVFTPGYTATFTDYTFLFEDLASRGYVVVSVDHTYEATAVELPTGRLAESVVGSYLGDELKGDAATLTFATSVRLADLRFVLNELTSMNGRANSPFLGRLDMSRVALAGHSMGGATAFLDAEQDSRVRAAIVIDGFVPGALIEPTKIPVLLLAAGREKWSVDECRLWTNLEGPRLAVNLEGAAHMAPSDLLWLAPGVIDAGAMSPEMTLAAVRDYIAAFLDANLREAPSEPMLNGRSSEYTGAAITTQQQSICSVQ